MWGYIIGFSVLMLVLAVIFARYVIRRLDSIESSPVSDRREEKIFKLYSEIESMLDSFEEYVGEVHEELEREREELGELSRRASSLYLQTADSFAQFSGYPQAQEHPRHGEGQPQAPQSDAHEISENKRGSRLSSRDRSALGGLKTKSQKVRFLMSRGLSLEEVARELGIGKGEVRLIADLDK